MWSPFSQFVMTQAVLNVMQGERYRVIPDEVRRYVRGEYGRPAAPIAPIVLERVGEAPSTSDIRPGARVPPALDRVRRERGPFDSDDDLLLAVFYGEEQCRAVRDAGPIRRDYPVADTPLLTLIKELAKRDVRSVTLRESL
jgi:oxaloacetate decarboxylase alpha subunit